MSNKPSSPALSAAVSAAFETALGETPQDTEPAKARTRAIKSVVRALVRGAVAMGVDPYVAFGETVYAARTAVTFPTPSAPPDPDAN
jgi:hypothetical protein